MIDDLYSAQVLRLAADMPRAGRLAAPQASVERVSRLCGSRVTVDVIIQDGAVAEFAQDVRACALGQAAAAVLGAHVIGATPGEIKAARDGLRAMLKQGAPPPRGRFEALSVLAQVRDFPARHASTLLAFEAVSAAVDEAVGRAAPASP